MPPRRYVRLSVCLYRFLMFSHINVTFPDNFFSLDDLIFLNGRVKFSVILDKHKYLESRRKVETLPVYTGYTAEPGRCSPYSDWLRAGLPRGCSSSSVRVKKLILPYRADRF
jgi:hypothetical protein